MALTPDAIPTNEQMLESIADRFYHPHKKQIWIAGALFFLAVVAFLAAREMHRVRQAEMWDRYYEATEGFTMNSLVAPDVEAARKQVEELDVLLREYPDDSVTPYAMQDKILAQAGSGDFEGALKTLDELRSRFKDFPANTLSADPDASGRPRSLSERLEDALKHERDWTGQRAYVHHWPSEDRLALVETSAGPFWLGFYGAETEAPKHVESFIRHAKAGDYNGTQVYSVLQGVDGQPERFEAGSLVSGLKGERDPALHDRDDPKDAIDPEDARTTIHHVYRVVSAAKMDSGESGSRFVVIARRNGLEKMNGEYTPFAAVMDREKSLETVDRIGRATTYVNHPDTKSAKGVERLRNNPYPPIYIRRVTIWAQEKLEEGHAWDTSRAGHSDQPEPWEASRTPARPEEFVEKKDETPKDGTPKKDESPKSDNPLKNKDDK
jgi:cyclophilin family peptidyl-prolyl cis-trans isomerase